MVGRFSKIVRNLPGAAVVDHPDSVLLPALVNAHTHLELSHLAHLSQQPPPATFTGWIDNMLYARARSGFNDEAVQEAARSSLVDQQDDGVMAIADISNTGLTRKLCSDFLGKLLCFKEYLGLRASGVEPSLKSLQAEADHHLCSAHAPYSTHADLLRALKKRALLAGHIFPIHVAEPQAESDMMSRGRGELVDFLERRGFWDGSFQPTGIDNNGSVQYLHQLGILDDKTLCVHSIHVSETEIELLIKTGSKVCLCPGSNRYLGVGKAPVDQYLQAGMLPALGTDSLASNPEISMWREMQLLADDHPDVDPVDILTMATAGGAGALGLDLEVGTLEPGKQATFLSVLLPDRVKKASDVYDYLVTTGSSLHPQWITS
jgi:cytosine/adenosine deaminase-related metal-dependent hydrolase